MQTTQQKIMLWYEVVIDDAPRCLPGKSIHDLIELIMTPGELTYVVTDDIEGGMTAYFQEIMHEPMKISEILPHFATVVQFDWGDFFLSKNYPFFWEETPFELIRKLGYPELISKADLTIRAVDDQYMYLYTRDESLVRTVADAYVTESIKYASLENYVHPY